MMYAYPHPLDAGYTIEVSHLSEPVWHRLLEDFTDANLYQTWAYGDVTSSHTNVVAIAQVRIARLPLIPVGIAYVLWGPLWKRSIDPPSTNVFRQAIRALRNEFVCNRGLTLRLYPVLYQTDSPDFAAILGEEQFAPLTSFGSTRTIVMDLRPSLDDLRAHLGPDWKRNLKAGEKASFDIIQGSDENTFRTFVSMYREMVSRKHFAEPNNLTTFQSLQHRLPEQCKMTVAISGTGGQPCAGIVCSILGHTAVYLFGATTTAGLRARGCSHILHWHMIKHLKELGIQQYDLNGINPDKNPGPYKFKSDLAGAHGTDVHFLGRFDAHGSRLTRYAVHSGDIWRRAHGRVRHGVVQALARPVDYVLALADRKHL